jgi:hypothetical protein
MQKRCGRLAQTVRIGGEGGGARGFRQMVRRLGAQDDDLAGVRLVASSRSGEWGPVSAHGRGRRRRGSGGRQDARPVEAGDGRVKCVPEQGSGAMENGPGPK